ncbi:MAG: hypothetical protein JWO86_701 [Myxococcaceae bacterium]|nr:hypothetical protein [Myxococcaceae bacterium]
MARSANPRRSPRVIKVTTSVPRYLPRATRRSRFQATGRVSATAPIDVEWAVGLLATLLRWTIRTSSRELPLEGAPGLAARPRSPTWPQSIARFGQRCLLSRACDRFGRSSKTPCPSAEIIDLHPDSKELLAECVAVKVELRSSTQLRAEVPCVGQGSRARSQPVQRMERSSSMASNGIARTLPSPPWTSRIR